MLVAFEVEVDELGGGDEGAGATGSDDFTGVAVTRNGDAVSPIG